MKSLLGILLTLLVSLPATAVELRGSAEYSRMAPSFNLGSPTQAAADNSWHIPRWLVGNWLVENETQVYSFDQQTRQADFDTYPIESHSLISFGAARSASLGEQKAPYVTRVDGGSEIELQYVTQRSLSLVGPDQVLSTKTATIVRIDKATRACKERYCQKTEEFITPLRNGNLLSQAQNMLLGEDGAVVYTTKNVRVMTRAGSNLLLATSNN